MRSGGMDIGDGELFGIRGGRGFRLACQSKHDEDGKNGEGRNDSPGAGGAAGESRGSL